MSNRLDPIRFFVVSLIFTLILTACASQPPAPTTEPGPPAQPEAANTPDQPASNPGNAAQMANPASVFCEENGGTSEIRTAADGSQSGACVFPDGSECDEWAYYRGECGPGQDVTAADYSDSTNALADSNTPPAVDAAVKLVASETGVDPAAIQVKTVEDKDWPDACLGLPAAEEMCAQAVVRGYQVVLTASGQDYTVRTSQTGDVARLEK